MIPTLKYFLHFNWVALALFFFPSGFILFSSLHPDGLVFVVSDGPHPEFTRGFYRRSFSKGMRSDTLVAFAF